MLKEYLQQSKADIESYLSSVLESPNTEYARLYDSMNYSLLMGGKRIRPIITKAVIESLGGSWDAYKDVVCAIELIHTYSLIHDDLPAMDNDDYRRGKLTNHRVYGDGMAILAGDGLLTYAFELVSKHTTLSAEQVVQIIHVLAKGAGPSGMVGGQAFDLQSEGKFLPLDELVVLHKGKTGALFSAAVEIGLIIMEATTSVREAYLRYADHLGLLFQNNEDFISPSTPAGIMALIEGYKIDLQGKDVVVVGRSNIVGKPVAALVLNNHGTVTICNSHTKNLADKTKNADILISAVGKPKFITEDMVKEGAVVIDVGINRVNGKLEGDVDFENVQKKASHITPVPGGVGALTVAMLLSNILKSFKANRGII